jgi:hypothetical protein
MSDGRRAALRRGSVLIITLLVAAIIFMLAVSYCTMVTVESKTIQLNDDANIALYCADAGLHRGFAELVNLDQAGIDSLVSGAQATLQFMDNSIFNDGQGRAGGYVSTIYGRAAANPGGYDPETPSPVPPFPDPIYGFVVPAPGDTFALGDRGRYRYRFTVQSESRIFRGVDLMTRRTIVAKVLIERAERPDDYQGFGKIEYWFEKFR